MKKLIKVLLESEQQQRKYRGELAEANAKSRSMRDELAFLVERADRLAEKIATEFKRLVSWKGGR